MNPSIASSYLGKENKTEEKKREEARRKGKGREGRGREGKGREGKGREGVKRTKFFMKEKSQQRSASQRRNINVEENTC